LYTETSQLPITYTDFLILRNAKAISELRSEQNPQTIPNYEKLSRKVTATRKAQLHATERLWYEVLLGGCSTWM